MTSLVTRARALGLLGAAPLAALATIEGSAQTTIPLRVGTVLAESYAEPIYARDGGFLGKAGINADVTLFSTGGQITNALTGGAVDVGMADVLQVALAVIHGIPLVFFGGGTLYLSVSPTTVLAVNKNSPIKAARDLEGQVIGLPGLRSMPECSVREWLAANGADLGKIRIVEVPPAAMAAAIAHGTIAAGVLSEPYVSAAGDSVRVLTAPYDACAKTFMQNAWFTTRDWLANNDAIARRLVKTAYDTARWANDHHDATVPMLEKTAKIDAKTIRAMTRATFSTRLDPKLIQPVLDIGFKYRIFDREVNAGELMAKGYA